MKIQVLEKEIHYFCKSDDLWGPKPRPLFSENESVGDNSVLNSVNASALQSHASLRIKNAFALFKGLSCIM